MGQSTKKLQEPDASSSWKNWLQAIRDKRDKQLQRVKHRWDETPITQLMVPSIVVLFLSLLFLYVIFLSTDVTGSGEDTVTTIIGFGRLTGDIAELFAGLGGWVAGFAGAYVAIRIANVATTIQTHDSITEFEELMEHDMELISDLNARIVKSSLTVRRAVTANLMWYEKTKKRKADHLLNDFDEVQNKHGEPNIKVELNKHLLDSLSCFASELESAIRNPVFRKLLNYGVQASKYKDLDNILALSIKDQVTIVDENEGIVEFAAFYENHTENMMSGINDLRISSLDETFRSYIKDLLTHHRDEDPNIEIPTISQLSWIIFGALVYRIRAENRSQTRNEGFSFLALMFGSLPNDQCLDLYYKEKIEDTNFNQKTTELLLGKMADLQARVFFPRSPGSKDETSAGFLREIKICLEYLENHDEVLLMNVDSSGISGSSDEKSISGTSTETKKEEKGKGQGADNNISGKTEQEAFLVKREGKSGGTKS